MNRRLWVSLAGVVTLIFAGTVARAEDGKAGTVKSQEAKGMVTDTGFGSFSLDEKGAVRKFSMSVANSRCEPALWRPAKGDEVSVTFTPIPNKKDGVIVLTVDKAVLVKAGPDTVPDLKSPVVVEVTDVGRLGITGKVATGQTLEFSLQRDTKRAPAGWTIAVGDMVKVEFKASARPFGLGVTLTAVSIERQSAAK